MQQDKYDGLCMVLCVLFHLFPPVLSLDRITSLRHSEPLHPLATQAACWLEVLVVVVGRCVLTQ